MSYNTLKKHVKGLVNEAIKLGFETNPMKDIMSRKGVANKTDHLKTLELF